MRRALSTLLIAAGVAVSAAAPASADPVSLPMPVTGQSYTDLRSPARTLTGADLPVGAWRDEENRFHSSKAYFTVDLSRLRGTRIFAARAFSRETAVTDCAQPRSVELWQTRLAEQPTWLKAPKELARFETGVTGQCQAFVSWEITSAITAAVAAGQEKATFALRMAGGGQFDTGYGRRYAPVTVEVGYNTPPSAASDPRVDAKPCTGTAHLVNRPPQLSAVVTDVDPVAGFQVRYVVTDVADAAKRHEGTVSHSMPFVVPGGFMEHGHTYEWTAQGEDGYDRGPASTPCRFTADLRGPIVAPVVTTTDFPQTGAGLPGTFTFDAGGDRDAVSFSYEGLGLFGTVQADQPGGKATLTVRMPTSGPHWIEVRSVDALGNLSAGTRYDFWVRPSWPAVTVPQGEIPLGTEVGVTFRSVERDVTEFVYEITGVPGSVTVPAVNGAAAVEVRVTDPWVTRLYVRAKNSDGDLTQSGVGEIHVAPSEPVVTRNGDLVTFAPGMTGVTEYVYRVNFGDEQTIAAGPDGAVTLPIDFGDHPFPNVEVRGRTADGLVSRTARLYVE
ncbi:hypothetical protein [Lentzea sp.]|uniref:hypothetical protein n=1 Tax=Lentzea sp. TaxID=56099 RepID=UPI002C15E82E|nr:hypothetical protein [Lentzea sp.]HUQ60657.1 hypothetical protein [Lentzea sp.]